MGSNNNLTGHGYQVLCEMFHGFNKHSICGKFLAISDLRNPDKTYQALARAPAENFPEGGGSTGIFHQIWGNRVD